MRPLPTRAVDDLAAMILFLLVLDTCVSVWLAARYRSLCATVAGVASVQESMGADDGR